MSDINEPGDEKGGEGKKTLSLKRGGNTVRQSFSHGRSNTVVVEKKRRRFSTPGSAPAGDAAPVVEVRPTSRPAAPKAPPAPTKPAVETKPVRTPPTPPAQTGGSSGSTILRQLSDDEQEARAKALAFAREREEERKEQEVAAEQERQARAEAERADTEKRKEEEAQQKAEEEARLAEEKARAEEEASKVAMTAEANPAAPATKRAPEDRGARKDGDDAKGGLKAYERPKAAEPKPTRRTGERRRGKLTLSNALDDGERERSLASIKRQREREKARAAAKAPREKIVRDVVIPETITIAELANRMAERSVDVVKMLMQQGQMLKASDIIDADTAQLIAEEMGHNVNRVAESDVEGSLFDDIVVEEDDHNATPRAPVVTIMGHVDHGKTSLLDALRNANVVSGEAGGITQHIGAYQVENNDAKITFIDTPGHAAFTAMRARGAQSTDIVILVVAADDGVMPQTIEAINHAKAAEVPIIVAVNKIDKPAAEPSRVRNELLQHEVFVESMGGDVQEVEVSALKGTNLDQLLDAITLQAEILDLKANADAIAQGTVVEAKLDKGRGPVATVLVQSGTLKVGDIVVAGAQWGKVRALVDDHNEQVNEAEPSKPVEVLGFNGAPEAGDRLAVVEDEAKAREITEYRERANRDKAMAKLTTQRGSLEQMLNQLQTSEMKHFPLLVKGDVQGSIEAIIGAVDKLGTEEVSGQVIHSAVGGITESDVTLATASNAPIIGFNVRANKQARDLAEQEGIEIRYYNIIYDLVDDVKAAMSGLLSPERRETFIGNAEILEVFNISKVGKVAGCRVTEGTVERGAGVRLIRDDVVIHEGELSTLKRFKDEVKEVGGGQECGMAFANYEDMRAGDVIECFRVEHVERSL